jgi:hypothetical protein
MRPARVFSSTRYPQVRLQDLFVGFEAVEGDLALVVAVAVALVAVFLEDGQHGLLVDVYR